MSIIANYTNAKLANSQTYQTDLSVCLIPVEIITAHGNTMEKTPAINFIVNLAIPVDVAIISQ